MKVKQILLAAGLVALSVTTMAQPDRDQRRDQPQQVDRDHRGDVQLNPQPLPPRQQPQQHDRDHRGDVQLNPQPLPPRDHRYDDRRDHRDRDFRRDRDHRHWNDYDQRRNYEIHRDHHSELNIGMRQREVFAYEWWTTPIYVKRHGIFEDYYYADSRFGQCWLRFGPRGRLLEIHC